MPVTEFSKSELRYIRCQTLNVHGKTALKQSNSSITTHTPPNFPYSKGQNTTMNTENTTTC